VTAEPARFVSLIHGTRRLNHITPNRQWMTHLREYLLDNGIADVSSFSWSGGVARGLRTVDSAAYADELLKVYEAARSAGGTLSIIAKSLGGWIAEQALVSIAGEIDVDLFLRIAVPDFRTVLPLPNVSRVVNVTSRNDRLYRAGRWIAPLFLQHGADGTNADEIVLDDASHFALTECIPLDGDRTTYDLYRQLLVTKAAETAGMRASRGPGQPEDR
jgi:hypothetical protein